MMYVTCVRYWRWPVAILRMYDRVERYSLMYVGCRSPLISSWRQQARHAPCAKAMLAWRVPWPVVHPTMSHEWALHSSPLRLTSGYTLASLDEAV